MRGLHQFTEGSIPHRSVFAARLSLFWLIGLTAWIPSLPAKDRFERWMDEVHWIASRAEKERFKQARTEEEQLATIEEFWARRDPTPGTDRNEYKEEHYRRWEFVNQNFSEGIPGWRADRGRIYLIHGPPDLQEFRALPATGRRGVRQERQSIVWTYYNMPTAKYFRGRMVIVFQQSVGITEQDLTLGDSRYALDRAQQEVNRSAMRSSVNVDTAVRYRIVAAGPPTSLTGRGGDVPAAGLGDYGRYVEDILRSPGDLLEEQVARRESIRAQLEEQVSSRLSFRQFPLSMIAQSFQGEEMARINVTWQFPISELEFLREQGVLQGGADLIAQVYDVSSGKRIDELFKTLEFRYSEDEWPLVSGEDFRYLNEFNLPAGDYRISSILKDSNSEKIASAEQTVRCSDVSPSQLAMSDLVLSRSVESAEGVEIGRELMIDNQWQIVPEPDLEFSVQERMVLFFKLYNARQEAGAPQVVVTYKFLKDGQVVKRSEPQKLTVYSDPDRATITFSAIVDLTGFAKGDYQLHVNAIDFTTKQYVISSAQLVVN